MSFDTYFLKGAEAGIVIGMIVYFTSYGLTKAISLFKHISR
jgi:hypothetical protein